MILKVKDKEYSFTATMKKIVGMNKKLNVKNLRDAFFKALNNVDFEFLADFLMEFADNDVQKGLRCSELVISQTRPVFFSLNLAINYYLLISNWCCW